MDIVMSRNTLWQNIMIRIGEEFTVPDPIGTLMVKRGVAETKESYINRKKEEQKRRDAKEKAEAQPEPEKPKKVHIAKVPK
jgi:hypothetical protein